MQDVFLIDEGILLEKNDEQFSSYNNVYDKEYGYYDENQFYVSSKDDAIRLAKEYVNKGVEKTYVIVSCTNIEENENVNECPVEDESYLLEDVIYSVTKLNGIIVEYFLKK